MKRFVGIFIFLMGLSLSGRAQQPAYHETLGIYKEATELLDKAKFGAAAEKFGEFIKRSSNTSYAHDKGDLVAEARYMQALCAFNLLNANCSGLFEAFVSQYPNHPRVNEAYFHVGKMHYMRKEYKESIPPFEKVESGNLTKAQVTETRFMLGYAYFKDGRDKEAMDKFRQIRLAEGVWGEMGAYFFAVLAYRDGRYEEAYDAFSRVKPESKFAENLDVLKASCLLKLQRYDELDALGEKLLAADSKASGEVFFILGNAAYDRSKFSDCITYFEKAMEKRVEMNRQAQYRLAYCYYRRGDFPKAQAQFEKVTHEEDTISQSAFYYLGHCFIKNNKIENARTAFKKASSQKFDKEIAGEALFQYAKASFETHFFDDAQSALQTFLKDYPNSEYADDAKALIGEILLFASNYKDAIDYLENNNGLGNARSRTAYQRACYLYGSSMFEKHKYDVAATHFKKAYNQNQDSKITQLAYYWYGESLFRQNGFEESIGAFKTFLAQPSASRHELFGMANYGIGWCKFKQKNFEEAGQYFEKFIGLADRDKNREEYVDALLRAGDCEFARKGFDGALRYYQQVRDFNGKYVDYAMFQIGLVHLRKAEYQKAAETMVQLAVKQQKSVYREQALAIAAQTYLSWMEDAPNGLKYAQMLVKDHPDSKYMPTALIVSAIAEGKSGNTQKAIYWFKLAAYEHCYNEGARTTALTNLAELLPANEYDDIERQSQEKCPIQNNDPANEKTEELKIEIADQRFFDENYGSANDRYTQHLKEFPNGKYVFHSHFFRGQSLEKLGRKDDALTDYEFIYKATTPNEFTVKALKAAADIQFAKGNKLAATELYTAMQDKSNRYEDRMAAQFGKAEVAFSNEDYPTARIDYLAVFSDPNTTDYSRTKARVKIAACDYFLGQKDQAYTEFVAVQAANTNTFGAESQYYIARILFDRKEYAESQKNVAVFNEKYSTYNYWKARAFLVLAEDYLALQDTFQADGILDNLVAGLMAKNEYPEIKEQAQKRLDEIRALNNGNLRQGGEPENEELKGDVEDMIEEENK
ncbi:MAG: tetratricopeptide repeat protein [Bacteroidetes bacterium]|nr:tetratricopeptide repeat protein [Bacteroidota bacterium]